MLRTLAPGTGHPPYPAGNLTRSLRPYSTLILPKTSLSHRACVARPSCSPRTYNMISRGYSKASCRKTPPPRRLKKRKASSPYGQPKLK